MNNLKSLFIIIFLVIFCLCSTSCIDDKCTQGDCKNGFGTLTGDNGVKYIGEWKNSSWHGQGTLTSPDGSQYSGEWKDGKKHGKGTLTSPDGSQHSGEWKDGKMLQKGSEQ